MAIGSAAFVIIGIVVIAAGAALVITLASNRPAASTAPHGPATVSVRAMNGKGNYVTNATLRIGDELKLIVTVPDWTTPSPCIRCSAVGWTATSPGTLTPPAIATR
jgi:hypothetical protein